MKQKVNWTQDKLKELDELFKSKVHVDKIAEKFGVTRQRLYQVLQQNGLKASRKTWKNRVLDNLTFEEIRLYRLWKNLNSRIQTNTVAFEDLLPAPLVCPVLGVELDYNFKESRGDCSPSIDRIDSSKGYVKGNVAVISWRANRIKNNGTAEEHRKIAEFMEEFQ